MNRERLRDSWCAIWTGKRDWRWN